MPLAWASLFALCTPVAHALGLGESQLRSALGEPLDLRVSLSASDTEDLDCLTVKGRSDLIPPTGLHVEVVSGPRGRFLEITSLRPVNDPAIALVVSAGCNSPVSRDYVVLLNPQTLAPVVPVAAEVAQAALPAPESPPAAPMARRSGGNALGTARGAREPAAGPAAVPPNPAAQSTAVPARAPRVPSRPPMEKRPAQGPQKGAEKAPNPPPEPISPSQPVTGHGDRLHLSRATDSPDLRISSDLLLTANEPPPSEERLAELRAAETQLLALLNGQPVETGPSPKEVELQQRIKSLGGDIATLRSAVQEAQDHSRSLENRGGPASLPWILGTFALLCLAAAGWFAWRYRSIQELNAAHPWWEQSQLAQSPREARPSGQSRPSRQSGRDAPIRMGQPIAEDDFTVSDFQPRRTPAPRVRPSTTPAAPVAPVAPRASRPAAPSPIAPRVAPVAAAKPPAPAPPAPTKVATAQSPAAAPGAAGVKPPIPSTSRIDTSLGRSSTGLPFGIVSSAIGSLEERVDSTELTRSAIDFNLDLPEIITSSPNQPTPPAPAPAAGPTPAASPAQAAFKLEPLDFDLPAKTAQAPAPAAETMGPDTILRLDDQASAGLGASATNLAGEQASLQFKLLQFAAVIEQATELQDAGEHTKAIAVLRQYVLRDETIPTLMWLMLFDLYRKVNKKPVYEALAEHFNRRYKRTMVRWDEELDAKTPQTRLSENPDIERQLKARWGTTAGLEMLRGLTCDRERSDNIIFNAALQRDLLAQAKIFPIEDSV
jgi:hypothetical protein